MTGAGVGPAVTGPYPSSSLSVEYNCLVAMHHHPVFQMPPNSLGQHHTLQVLAFTNHVLHSVPMSDANNSLLNDWSSIKIGRCIMSCGTCNCKQPFSWRWPRRMQNFEQQPQLHLVFQPEPLVKGEVLSGSSQVSSHQQSGRVRAVSSTTQSKPVVAICSCMRLGDAVQISTRCMYRQYSLLLIMQMQGPHEKPQAKPKHFRIAASADIRKGHLWV